MGNLERAAIAIPFELKPIEIPADVKKIEVDIETPQNETIWPLGINVSHLPEDQRVRVGNLLLNVFDVFFQKLIVI